MPPTLVTVHNTIVTPDSQPRKRVSVRIRIIATTEGGEAPAYRPFDDAVVRQTIQLRTNTTGVWSTELQACDELEPDGCVYEVLEDLGTGSNPYWIRPLAAHAATDPKWVGDILAFEPTDLPSPIATATAVRIQEGDVDRVLEAEVLDFAAGDFDVTESPADEANISIAAAHTGSSHAAVQAAAEATAATNLAAALAAHLAAGNPHGQYILASLIGSALGVAPLDGASLIPDSFIPGTIARDAEVAAAIATAIADVIASAPGVLDTLDELAAALGDDPNFATTITTLIATKVALSLYNAHTILVANVDDTPVPLTIAEGTILGRLTGGNIAALTPAQIKSLLAIAAGDLTMASARILGRVTAGSGPGEELTPAQVKTLLAIGVGDLVNASTARIFGRVTAGSGPGEELTAAQVKTLLAIASADITDFTEAVQDRIGADVQGGAGVNTSYDDGTGKTTISVDPAGYGAFLIGGDSRAVLGGGGTAGASITNGRNSALRRVPAVLGVPDVYAYGKSGAQLCSPNHGNTSEGTQGLGHWVRHLFPEHWYAPRSGSHSGIPTRPTSSPFPAPGAFFYGYNDVLRVAAAAAFEGTACFTRHLRALLCRHQAQMLYHAGSSTVAYTTGFGTTVATRDSGHGYLCSTSRAGWRKSNTINDKFTITLPAELPIAPGGSCKVFVGLIGPTNTRCYLNGIHNAGVTTLNLKGSLLGDQGYKILTAGDVVDIAGQQVTLGSTADGGLTWTGCTALSAQRADSTVVTMPTNTINVGWADSTAPGASGEAATYVCGAGIGNDGVYSDVGNVRKTPGFVFKVFTLTEADAGLTIAGKVAGKVGNEFVGFDCWGIISANPNPAFILNTADMGGTMPGGGVFYAGTVADNMNAAMATVAAEFTDAVVVDLDTELRERFKATVRTAITSTGTTVLNITPVNAARLELKRGSVIRVLGAGGVETMLVNGTITKTSDTNWDVPVQRGYDGSAAQASIVVGKPVMERSWLSPDWIHPSNYGHEIIAAKVLASIRTVARTDQQSAAGGALLITDPLMRDGAKVKLVQGAGRQAGQTPTLGDVYTLRVEVTEPCNLICVSCEVSSAATAGGIMRAGIRADGAGEPGQLIAELDTPATTTATLEREATDTIGIPLRPGTYWIDVVFQVAAPGLRGHTNANLFAPWPPIPLPTADTGGTAAIVTVGYTCTGETGALDTLYPTAGKAPLQASCPLLWARFDVPERD